MVLNLPQEHICYLLNTMGMRVQGGETFHDGDMVSGIYEDCSIRLKKVHETGRDVLRLIIPDKYASQKTNTVWNHTNIRNWICLGINNYDTRKKLSEK